MDELSQACRHLPETHLRIRPAHSPCPHDKDQSSPCLGWHRVTPGTCDVFDSVCGSRDRVFPRFIRPRAAVCGHVRELAPTNFVEWFQR